MANGVAGAADAGERFVRLDDGEMHVVQDGKPGSPALLLIHGSAASTACWDLVVPRLAASYRVIRVDLLGCGRPGAVTALALIDMGPSPEAKIPERLLVRLLLARFPGRLLWHLKTEATIRKAAGSGFTRPVDIPDAMIQDVLGMTYRAFARTLRAPVDYLGQRSLPDRLTALGLPVLVIFGTDDRRWRSSSAAAYRTVPGARVELLPGVGHTPIMEDPQTTAALLLEFAAATGPST